MPKVSEIGTYVFLKRLIRKIKSIVKPFHREDKNLYVYTPLILPHYGSSMKKGLNAFLLRVQIKLIQKVFGFRNPIVWIENPVGMIVAKQLDPALILYYRIDKFESHSELRDPEEIVDLDERLTREADLILCVSMRLYEEKLALRKEGVYYVPHGVDFNHFRKAMEDLPIPDDVKDIKHPLMGYFGTLDAKNDDSIIQYCATQRQDLSFVLIGEMGGKNRLLAKLPNVHFLGYKEYSQLPYYGRTFDACIMFWKSTDWIEYCNPVKTNEYLAMGKPVISTPFHEISKQYNGIIAIARSPEEFLKKIEEEITKDSPERQKIRMDFVRNETWEKRAEYVSQLIAKKINS